MQNDVVVVVRSRADVARSACLELNEPVVIEHLGDISRPDVVGRVEAARLGLRDPAIVEHVMHREQLSTRRHGGEESVFGGVGGSTQQRREPTTNTASRWRTALQPRWCNFLETATLSPRAVVVLEWWEDFCTACRPVRTVRRSATTWTGARTLGQTGRGL
jgi:hypothetical protein